MSPISPVFYTIETVRLSLNSIGNKTLILEPAVRPDKQIKCNCKKYELFYAELWEYKYRLGLVYMTPGKFVSKVYRFSKG